MRAVQNQMLMCTKCSKCTSSIKRIIFKALICLQIGKEEPTVEGVRVVNGSLGRINRFRHILYHLKVVSTHKIRTYYEPSVKLRKDKIRTMSGHLVRRRRNFLTLRQTTPRESSQANRRVK